MNRRRLSEASSLAFILLVTVLSIPGTTTRATEYSVQVNQVTNGPKHHFFGYIGHSLTIPWSEGGRYVLALQTEYYLRMPKRGEKANVVLIDTQDNNQVVVLDQTHAWNFQQGTMFYWNPDAPDTQFFFNDLDPKTGVVFTVLYDIKERRRVREFRYGNQSIANGGVAPGGSYFAAFNYGKVSKMRRVISYAGASDWTSKKHANPKDDGLFKVDTRSGEKQLLLSYHDLAQALDPKYKELPIYVHHTLWNRDSDRIFFLARGRYSAAKGERKKVFRPNAGFVINSDGTHLKRVRFDGHPEWANGKQLVLPGNGVFDLFDVDKQESVGSIGDEGVFQDTWMDNALSPNARWYVGSQSPTKTECSYTFYHRPTGAFVHSPSIRIDRSRANVRIDPAPRWNRTSDAILVPGIADDDSRQLYVLRVVRKNE